MEKHEPEKLPSLAKYLPAIFQKQATEEYDPLRAMLEICEANFSGIEETINHVECFFDPETAPGKHTDHSDEFLSLLASWVALRLDEGWFAADGDEPERGHGGEQKARYLIKNAAVLYRSRGTVSGLKLLLKAFYDIETLIVEWAWPQGMEIGATSTIGMDTFLMDRPDIMKSFLVIWMVPEEIRKQMESSARFFRISIIGQTPPVECLIPIWDRKGSPMEEKFVRKLQKIRQVIDQEKPAHTRFFLVLGGLERPQKEPPLVRGMVIGVHSTIGLCFINGGD